MLMCCLSCAKADSCEQADRVEDYCSGHEERPMTNADIIRQMSDEELVEWVKLMVCKYRSCGNCPMNDWCTPGRGIAEWLKQEAGT